MRGNKSSFIALVFVLIAMTLWSVNLFSSSTIIYGPKKFTRTTGKPVVVTETFSAPSATAHYRLIVLNGENGKDRVSSATVKINGKEILRENDFNQQVGRIERSVNLLLSNSISVELKSAPGSFITVTIECLDCLVITNHPPVADGQSVTTDEDVAAAITLVATDPDNDLLIYQIVTEPGHGTLSGTLPNITYTPRAHFYGFDSFTFKVNDGKLDSNNATVSIIVTRVNHPPIAQDQSVTTDEDVAKFIILVATDPDGDPLTYQILAQPVHGALSGTLPNVTYAPTAHFYGSDTFTFKTNDGNADSNIATVSITVMHVNHPPTAQDQSVTTDEDVAKSITLVAIDPDGDALTYTIMTQPGHGALSGAPPSITYTPTAYFHGSDSFKFKTNDGKLDSNTATVTITVTHVNHPPMAWDQTVAVDENEAKDITLVTTDPDGDVLTYEIVVRPTHGTLSGMPPYVTYTPAGAYSGSDSFTFKANDGYADSNMGTVYITVKTNHLPVAQNQCLTTDQDTAKTIILSATDADGDPLTYTIVTQPGHGVLSGAPPIVTYTPAPQYFGRDSFTFKANDGKADSNKARVSINVTPTPGIITTVAGDGLIAFSGDGGLAIEGMLSNPFSVAVDTSGNLYIADATNYRIRKVDKNGIITTVAGNGTEGYSGDSGPATEAMLGRPISVAVDSSGNLYISDGNNRIRRVDMNGIITTVAGNGTSGYGGDDGRATEALLNWPTGLSVDVLSNLYIADKGNHRIRRVDTRGIITTVAGNGTGGYAGDGGSATIAMLFRPEGVAVDSSGNLYIADTENNLIRKVDKEGIITTVAGNNIYSTDFTGDGGPATAAGLWYPSSVAVDASGNLYILDGGGGASPYGSPYSHLLERYLYWGYVRKVDTNGIITAFAGRPYLVGYGGDGGPAINANLDSPEGLAVDFSGNLYIADTGNDRIRTVDLNGIITTAAGNGMKGGGDGGPATDANLDIRYYDSPAPKSGVAIDSSGNFYIADVMNHRIRKVDSCGIIATVAGNGSAGISGDGGSAIQAELSYPTGVALDTFGNLYIADHENGRIRKVGTNGVITTIAGGGAPPDGVGDGGFATQAVLRLPSDLAIDASGNLYIADTLNHCIRKVDTKGIITTVAGICERYGYNGDSLPATRAMLEQPEGIAIDSSGSLYIADTGNRRIRRVDLNGVITTVAGNGYGGNVIDGGPASEAHLWYPTDVAVDSAGNLYIVDNYVYTVRKVNVNGIITTVAGNVLEGEPYSGDGGIATAAGLLDPTDVSVDALGNLYISDRGNNRVRKVWGLSKTATLVGKVIDSSTGLPLTGVEVALITPLNRRYSTLTDLYSIAFSGQGALGFGFYALSLLPPGDFTVTFSKSGYFEQVISGTLAAGQTQKFDIQLAPPIPPLRMSITFPRYGETFNVSPITVMGDVNNNANVTVNDVQASVSNNTFSASIPLNEGLNSITATATDEYGQTASQSIYVTFYKPVTGGIITGTVTDSSTGLPVASATVSVTDSSMSPLSGVRALAIIIIAKTALTDSNGGYTINNISPGPFTGTITKEGYVTYNFSGKMVSEQTVTINAALNPIVPIISNIVVSGITLNSATITWTTDQPTDSLVEYGTTTSYGNLATDPTMTTSHTILLNNLSSATTFHFRVTSKNSYGFSSFSGDFAFVTLSPPPAISALIVSNITKDSATITWTTDQLTDSLVEYGTTTFYGSSLRDSTLTTNHTITLSNLISATTYHFKVTSTNSYGVWSSSGDLTFKTSSPLLISLAITFPSDGSTMSVRDTIVKGTVMHSRGSETGVVINGMLANSYGSEFVVNHVPLVEGSNTITAAATDVDGNTETASITVDAVTPGNYIKITSNTESALSPLEAILTIESSLDLTNASLTYVGPAEVEFLPTSVGEYRVRMITEGIYYFTAIVADSSGNLYSDTVAITILPEAYLDGLLRGKWEAMKVSLSKLDIEGAVQLFALGTQEAYRNQFNALKPILSNIVDELNMTQINLISIGEGVAEYEILVTRGGTTYSFSLKFMRDPSGVWKIWRY